MSTTQEAVALTNPLRDADILLHVFGFLSGNWFFLGAVCSEWRAVYAGMADQKARFFVLYFGNDLVTWGPKTTLFSAAVATPATMAYVWGLERHWHAADEGFQVIVGARADMQTLAA
jgi:hypothetical protein